MKNKIIVCTIAIIVGMGFALTFNVSAQKEAKHNYIPKSGYVPDKETAIRVAVAVWIPIYGAKNIEKEKPYTATLKDNVWFVCGSLPQGWKGGVAEAEIDKSTGKILRISHGR